MKAKFKFRALAVLLIAVMLAAMAPAAIAAETNDPICGLNSSVVREGDATNANIKDLTVETPTMDKTPGYATGDDLVPAGSSTHTRIVHKPSDDHAFFAKLEKFAEKVGSSAWTDEFYITLKVEGNAIIPPPAPVVTVLVLDISTSMNRADNGTDTNIEANRRIRKVKDAAKTFVSMVSSNKGYVALGTYNSRGQLAYGTFVTDGGNVTALNNAIENLSPSGYTNIQGGLMAASQILNSKTGLPTIVKNNVDTKYNIILMSDGVANMYYTSVANTYNGYNTHSLTGGAITGTDDGKQARVNGTVAALKIANLLKGTDVSTATGDQFPKIFSVSIGTADNVDPTAMEWYSSNYNYKASLNPSRSGNGNSSSVTGSYVAADKLPSADCKFNYVQTTGFSAAKIYEAIAGVISNPSIVVDTTKTSKAVITDILPANMTLLNIESAKTSVTGDTDYKGEVVVTGGKTITWDIPTTLGAGNTATLKIKVKTSLRCAKGETAAAHSYIDTNTKAYLTYQNNSENKAVYKSYTAYFPMPQVHVPVKCNPSISIEKLISDSADADYTKPSVSDKAWDYNNYVYYQINVKNTGTVTLNTIKVTDTFTTGDIADVELVSGKNADWTMAESLLTYSKTLAPGATITAWLRYKLPVNFDASAKTYKNSASVTANFAQGTGTVSDSSNEVKVTVLTATLHTLTLNKKVLLNETPVDNDKYAFTVLFDNLRGFVPTILAGSANITKVSDTEYNVSIGNNENVKFGNLPAGATYNINETDAKGATSTIITDAGSTSALTAVGLFASDVDITYTNVYAKLGVLNVTKNVTGNDKPVSGTKFEFTMVLKNSDSSPYTAEVAGATKTSTPGEYKFSLADTESVSFSGLPNGLIYAISETDSKSAKTVEFKDGAGNSKGTSVSGTVNNTVESGYSASYVCTNDYSRTPSMLRISKTIDSDFTDEIIKAAISAKVFSFKLTLANLGNSPLVVPTGATEVTTAEDTAAGKRVFTFEFDGSNLVSIDFNGLFSGTSYEIEETVDGGADEVVFNGADSAAEGTNKASGTIKASQDDIWTAEDASVTCTNYFIPGRIVVDKKWINTPDEKKQDVEVELYADDVATGRTAILSADNDPAWTATFDNLYLSGVVYSIKENTSLTSFATPVYTADEGFNEDHILTITVTNTYEQPETAEIRAQKKVTGEGATLAAGQFTFYLCDLDGTVIKTATNDGAGLVVFTLSQSEMPAVPVPTEGPSVSAITSGVKTFIIKEKIETPQGWTYDTSTFEVTVYYDGTVSYGELPRSMEIPTFVNSYEKPTTTNTTATSSSSETQPSSYPTISTTSVSELTDPTTPEAGESTNKPETSDMTEDTTPQGGADTGDMNMAGLFFLFGLFGLGATAAILVIRRKVTGK